MKRNKKQDNSREARINDLAKRKAISKQDAAEVINAVDDKHGAEGVNVAPHIKVTAKGEAYFEQGDIRFTVDHRDLNNVVGSNGGDNVIDKLLDSQVVTLATANGLNVKPYSRELLRPVLTGLIQLCWYRDLAQFKVNGKRVDEEHLRANQAKRVDEYNRKLASYVEPAADDNAPRARKSSTDWSKTYKFVKDVKASGRAGQLLAVVKSIKAGTLAQIVEASKGKVETKQDIQKIVTRFMRELLSSGAVVAQ